MRVPGSSACDAPIRWGRGLLLSALLAVFPLAAGPALADPVLQTTTTPAGPGLVQHDVSVDFADGLSRSGFIEIEFSGNFSSSELETEAWPDVQDELQNSTTVRLQGGTGGGSQVDVVPIGQLVVPGDETVTYTAVVSRAGQNYVLVPEPTAGLAAGAALATASLLRVAASRRRRGAA